MQTVVKRSAQVLKIPPRHADGVFLWCAKHVWNLWDPQQNLKATLKTSGAMHGALHLHLHCMCMRKGQAKILIESISIETICEQNSARQPLHKLPSVPAAHVWKVNQWTGENAFFFCFQSEQKQKNVKQFKKVHLFEGKVFFKSFGCQVIFNLLKFQGQVNTTMEWQGWIRGNFSQISR